eukprot:TRINITY_DN3623_c0_g1_i4.p1 TRINITY_DN3623_c0_g1~~TRINITY_DN3623_c0_g1_i4.p1  ORF type:complete len:321 (-),score=30.18 TRINITY_DN3623_c0_g1_i4:252-1214(-)
MPSLCQAALIWICTIVAPQAMFLQPRNPSRPILDAMNQITRPFKADPDWARIKIPFMLTGTEFKTGTEVTLELTGAIASTLAKRHHATPYVSYNGYGSEVGVGSEPTALHFNHASEYIYTNLTSRSGHFRFILVIRDPIEMVISGYWYIRRQSGDLGEPSPIITRAEREQLLGADVITGLEIVAQGMLKTTFPNICGFLKASNGDVRVMTIGLEDIESDLNQTVSCMYRFLLEPVMPNDFKSILSSSLEVAQAADARRRKKVAEKYAEHFNADENRVLSRKLIDLSSNPVWEEIRKTRHELGYIATQDPASFRLPWPAQC